MVFGMNHESKSLFIIIHVAFKKIFNFVLKYMIKNEIDLEFFKQLYEIISSKFDFSYFFEVYLILSVQID